MSRNYYSPGQWNVTCDVCSKKIKSSEARQRWDGFVVCPDDFEMRHPQDFVKARQDKISVPFARPIPTIVYVPQNYTERVQDTAYLLDVITFTANYLRSISDNATTSDGVIQTFGTQLSDTVTTSEALTAMIYKLVTVTDTVTTTDTSISTVATSSTQINGSAVNGDSI